MIAQTSKKIQDFILGFGNKKNSFYCEQNQAIRELKKRQKSVQSDDSIVSSIRPTPSIQHLLDRQHLVFFRQIGTPLHETLRVIEIAKEINLPLCILEYYDDKFVSAHNIYKHGLGKLPIHQFVDRKGNDIFTSETIVDFNKYSGHKLKDVYTKKGESLIDFHHDFFNYITGIDISEIAVDASDWFAQFHNDASEYYSAYFSLFIKHNILAEVFLSKVDDFDNFTEKVVSPSFNKVNILHKYPPIIVNYQPKNEQSRPYWDRYPARTSDFLRKKGYI